MSFNDLKVALVHDELVRKGGAERVFEEIAGLFAHADIYALYSSNTPRITINSASRHIHTTFLQSLPSWFRASPRRVVGLLPHAAEQLDLSHYDLVISSSSAFAKGVITRSTIPHICYCHTPTRYLWEARAKGPLQIAGQHFLRLADFAAAQRPDTYIANSTYTQSRINEYYRRESTIIHPPINTQLFTPGKQNRSYFLCVGRLTPSKAFDQAITICEKLRLPLHIVGVGRDRARLTKLAGKYTTFLGKLSDEELRTQYRGAYALLQPGTEDFGMTAVEALACGTPVIAYGRGGIQDILTRREFGITYDSARPELLANAIRQFQEISDFPNPATLQSHALQFSRTRFISQITKTIEDTLQQRHNI